MSSYCSHYIRHPPSENVKNDVKEFIDGFYGGVDSPEPPHDRYAYHCLFLKQVPSYDFYKAFHSIARDTMNAVTKGGNTPLHYLCNRGDLDRHYSVFEVMLGNLSKRGLFSRFFGTPIPENFRFTVNNQGITPFMLLVGRSGNTRCVQLMLEYRARVIDRDMHKNTVYHHMFLYDGALTSLSTYRAIHHLIPNMLHSTNKHGNTPLHLLCAHNNVDRHLSLLETVLRNKANINARNRYGCTPLMLLVAHPQNTKSLELLLHYRPRVDEVDSNNHTAYHFIFAKQRLVTTLPRYQYLHHKLIKSKNIQDKNGRTPLHWFCIQDNCDAQLELLKCMIKNGLDHTIRDARGRTPLMDLLQGQGNVKCILYLFQLTSSSSLDIIDQDGNTIFHYLFRRPNYLPIETYQQLFADGLSAYINTPNQRCDAPLHFLCNQPGLDAHLDIVQFMLDHKADPNQENDSKMTPLMLAIPHRSSTKAIKLLITDYGGNTTQQDIYGNTLYHHMFVRHAYIAPLETYQYIHQIFPQGLHMINRQGNTPLHLFCSHQNADLHVDVLEAMIANDPPKYVLNKLERTPYQCVTIGSSRNQSARLLKQAGFAPTAEDATTPGIVLVPSSHQEGDNPDQDDDARKQGEGDASLEDAEHGAQPPSSNIQSDDDRSDHQFDADADAHDCAASVHGPSPTAVIPDTCDVPQKELPSGAADISPQAPVESSRSSHGSGGGDHHDSIDGDDEEE